MRFTCAARTDVGIVRSGNEDNYLMLSDARNLHRGGRHGRARRGRGGERDGRPDHLARARLAARACRTGRCSDRIRAAIRPANDAIFERTLSEHDKRGMGTTATVLVLMPRRYLIGQVGDSRAYLLREGQLISSPRTTPTSRSRWTPGCSLLTRPECTLTAT